MYSRLPCVVWDNSAVQRQVSQLDTVLVYDDEPDQRRTRLKSASLLVEQLRGRGILARCPSISATGLRHDALSAVLEGGRTLLLADLIGYDDAPRGARLLRAISTRPEVAARTWRIALTRRADPRIAERLTGHADAVVVYDDTDVDSLVEAVVEVLRTSPNSAEQSPPTFPAGVSEKYIAELNRSLRIAMHGEFSPADAEAAFRWIDDTHDGVTAETDPLERPVFYREHDRGRAVERMAELLTPDDPSQSVAQPTTIRALQQKLKRRSSSMGLRQLRARARKTLWPVMPSGLSDTVTPQAVLFVTERGNQSRARDWAESKDLTWLTEAEHIAAWALIDAAEKKLDDLAKAFPDRRKMVTGADACIALNDVFNHDRLHEQCAAVGVDVWDAHYAVCTIVDWLVDLDDAPYVTS